MGFRHNGLIAIALATLVALAGVSAQAAPVAATDPSPTPAPEMTPTPTPTPDTATPTPTPAPTATPVAPPQPTTTPATTTLTAARLTPAPPKAKPSLGARIARIALAQRHKRYVFGSSGPGAFDCSGLVRYAYRLAGVSKRLGGGHSARGMYLWARVRGLTSRSHPRVGDVVIYGGGTHVGIYIGNGLVISALNPRQGIRVTGLHALGARFTTFIHTHL